MNVDEERASICQFLDMGVVTKILPCLICVLVLLALSSPECDAVANGALAGKPGRRSFQEKKSVIEDARHFAIKRELCDAAESLGCRNMK